MKQRKLGLLDRRRIARATKHFDALDVERIQRARGELSTFRESKRRPLLFSRTFAIPSAIMLFVIIGFCAEYFISNHIAIARQLWRQVPDSWEAAQLWSKGGELGFEDPIAIHLKEANGELLVADPFKDAVFRIDSNGDLSTLITKAEIEHVLGFALSGGADGPATLAMQQDVLYVGISIFEGQGNTEIGDGGAILYVTSAGAMGVLADSNGNPVRTAFNAESESHYGMIARDNVLYVSGVDGTIRVIQVDESLTRAQDIEKMAYHFDRPTALAIDSQGYLYVADEAKSYVVRFFPNGHLDENFRIEGLDRPTGLAFGKDGALFIAESGAGGRIRWYTREGEQLLLQGEFSRFGKDSGVDLIYLSGFQGPAIAADPTSGVLFVADNTGEMDNDDKAPAVYRCVPSR